VKVASFLVDGAPRFGVAVDGGLVEASGWVPGEGSLQQTLADGRLRELEPLASARPDVRFEDARFLPPIPEPRRILCVGVNYDAHRVETGRSPSEHPTLFVRFPSSLVGHGEPLVRPAASTRFDFEGELAVVIGRAGRHIGREEALGHVAGYACFDDGSVRDYQRHTSQFTPGKNFDRSGGFGPWLVTTDEIPDPSAMELTTRVNGQVVQRAPTSDLVFDVPSLIAYISTFTTLEPGDVIATGTPSGVGDKRDPPLYLRPGDTLEVEISGIGTLRHPVVDEGG
jgi:2-keto-4-pentenoate hydratase/2-oxohepta-3-ene-1,7-dioic acid hydratase in catechol pathway